MEEIEIWKDIQGYEGVYQVSNFGRVKSLERKVKHPRGGLKTVKEKLRKLSLDGRKPKSYYQAGLQEMGKLKMSKVHILVAIHFVPNPNSSAKVNHLDNNPLNNHYTNLEWATQRENVNHGMTFQERTSKYPGVSLHKPTDKWVASIWINGRSKYLGLFPCEIEASQAYQTALKSL